MSTTTDSTTLICLFHHNDQAQAALRDLENAGIPRTSITTIGGGSADSADAATLETLGVPSRDINHLRTGLAEGGVIISVFATGAQVARVESIFDDNKAKMIDETGTGTTEYAAGSAAAVGAAGLEFAGRGTAADGQAIPIVEEELQVGKRTVDQGGVRVYKRIVEIPAEETVRLREEHVVVQRNAVDRPATAAELESQGSRSIELVETAEEAVVGKTARVVEEVVVGKESGERTERIRDTVRKTEVEIENLPSADAAKTSKTNY